MLTLAQIPPGHPARALLTGRTPWIASQADPRFSYGLYVPREGREINRAEMLVLVHGTSRGAQLEVERWVGFAEQHDVVLFAPLFPAGIQGPDDVHNYKLVESNGLRYDRILLSMLEEARERWGVDVGRFHLAGHSGGAQFALRMLLLHPGRLRSVIISAPGRITRVDDTAPWPRGTADVPRRFGIRIDAGAIAQVPTLLTIGSEDTGVAALGVQHDDSQQGFGETRRARLDLFEKHLRDLGVTPTVRVVPGGHHGDQSRLAPSQEFLSALLPPTT